MLKEKDIKASRSHTFSVLSGLIKWDLIVGHMPFHEKRKSNLQFYSTIENIILQIKIKIYYTLDFLMTALHCIIEDCAMNFLTTL